MDEPNAFEDRSPRFGLPFLFPGQAQREFYLNESMARLDMLLHPAIEGRVSFPPSLPVQGQIWLISEPSELDWTDKHDFLAGWDGQQWTFVSPRRGMQIFDLSAARWLRFDETWTIESAPEEPKGGSVIDVEARETIGQLIAVLQKTGLF